MATLLDDIVYAEWDSDGDLYLFTALKDGKPDDISEEIWLSPKAATNLIHMINQKEKLNAEQETN